VVELCWGDLGRPGGSFAGFFGERYLGEVSFEIMFLDFWMFLDTSLLTVRLHLATEVGIPRVP
jgi:hypothetical protein